MRTVITFLALLCFNSLIIAQNLDEAQLKKSIDSLKNIINDNNKKIDTLKAYNGKIESEIKKRSSELNDFLLEKQIGGVFVCTYATSVYEKPGVDGGNSLIKLSKGDRVKVLDLSEEYSYRVFFKEITGFAYKAAFISEEEANKRLAEVNRKIAEEKLQKEILLEQDSIFKERQIKATEKRKKDLIKKYGQTNGTKILEQKIWIGMTKEMVIESWGWPDDINRSVGSWGVHEQMVYGKSFVYIENDILTSWQD